jgi:hypothetical protein
LSPWVFFFSTSICSSSFLSFVKLSNTRIMPVRCNGQNKFST